MSALRFAHPLQGSSRGHPQGQGKVEEGQPPTTAEGAEFSRDLVERIIAELLFLDFEGIRESNRDVHGSSYSVLS